MSDLQEVWLVGQGDGLGEGHLEGVGRDATQEGHGVRAAEEGVVLAGLGRNRILILVLQRGAWRAEGQPWLAGGLCLRRPEHSTLIRAEQKVL